jgi:hypothetical protein
MKSKRIAIGATLAYAMALQARTLPLEITVIPVGTSTRKALWQEVTSDSLYECEESLIFD